MGLDGFRSIDGIVRQYVLTSDKMKGVAGKIIGKDRVFAIGLSFFTSKEKKEIKVKVKSRSCIVYGQPQFWSPVHSPISWQIPTKDLTKGGGVITSSTTDDKYLNENYSSSSDSLSLSNSDINTTNELGVTYSCTTPYPTVGMAAAADGEPASLDGIEDSLMSRRTKASVRSVQTKKLEVSAGAKISQSVYDDPEKLEFWHNDSEGILCVNYVSEEECRKIVEQGEVNLEGHPEGFLKEVPVGN